MTIEGSPLKLLVLENCTKFVELQCREGQAQHGDLEQQG